MNPLASKASTQYQKTFFTADGSNDPLRPSLVEADKDGLQLTGTVVAGDPDYFYISIPEGQILQGISLEHYASTDLIAFYAIQVGKQFTAGTDTSKMLIWDHLGPKDLGKNLLAQVSTNSIDDIVLWVQQTGSATTDYRFQIWFDLAQGKDIIGEDIAETLTGTDAPERIFGNAGDDTIIGGLRADTIDGGAGLDTVVYNGTRDSYQIKSDWNGLISVSYSGPLIAIYPPPPTEGIDQLSHVERIQFKDRALAFDAQGAAGKAASLLLTLFGPNALKLSDLSGLALSLVDQGYSSQQIAKAALPLVFSSPPNGETLVKYVWKNLTGDEPSADSIKHIAAAIDAGPTAGGVAAEDLIAAAASLDWTAMQLDYVGLWQSGWELILPAG
jgi:Ca2+-binding RTX toxin-like protein